MNNDVKSSFIYGDVMNILGDRLFLFNDGSPKIAITIQMMLVLQH